MTTPLCATGHGGGCMYRILGDKANAVAFQAQSEGLATGIDGARSWLVRTRGQDVGFARSHRAAVTHRPGHGAGGSMAGVQRIAAQCDSLRFAAQCDCIDLLSFLSLFPSEIFRPVFGGGPVLTMPTF